MEPIPEEDHDSVDVMHSDNVVKHERKTRLTEVYTSEQVDTLVRFRFFVYFCSISKVYTVYLIFI